MIALNGLLAGSFYGVSQAEYDALMAFYVATDGPNWTNNTGWGVDPNVAAWYGVTVAGGVVTRLDLSSNALAGDIGITIYDLTSITVINVNSNAITDGDFSQNILLTQPWFASNSFTAFDFSTNTLISNVSLGGNPLTSNPDFTNNTAITTLRIANSDLTALDLSALVNITILQCHENTSLGTLSSTNNVLLTFVDCHSCGLSALDTSTNSLLQTLVAYSNAITAFDFSANFAARNFSIQNNGMSEAEVDATLLSIYTNRASYTYATPVLDISGTNAAPSGTLQYSAAPSTGKEYIYALVNDDDAEGFNLWTITYTA